MTSSASGFPAGDTFAVLFNNSQQDSWHWAICISIGGGKPEQKFHVKQLSGDIWKYEFSPDSLNESMTCCAVIKIGSLECGTTLERVDELLKTIPMTVPTVDAQREPRFTCRVWFREAIRVLNANGIITCPDVDKLEEECRMIAKTNDLSKGGDGYIYADSRESSSGSKS